jgi:predicted site-specific integrase-resolvase
MEKLMKPSEYAKELGISRQAVYAKIKSGILKSKDVDGKLYIVVEQTSTKAKNSTPKPKDSSTTVTKSTNSNLNYEELLKAKDETISVLKDTISDLKESNKEISTTLRSEIDLLKEAFYEMRSLYTNQLEYQNSSQDIKHIEILQEEESIKDTSEWVGVKKFVKIYGIKPKKVDKLKKRFKKLYKNSDERFDMVEDKLKIDISQDFSDILE